MLPDSTLRSRRRVLLAGAAILLPTSPRAASAADEPFEGDPYGSLQWPELRKEFLGHDARAAFDPRVVLRGPAFAEDPMNVPIGVSAEGLKVVERIVVLVDRNPIRKVLDFSSAPLEASCGPTDGSCRPAGARRAVLLGSRTSGGGPRRPGAVQPSSRSAISTAKKPNAASRVQRTIARPRRRQCGSPVAM